jgi:hypothetical protein
MRRRVSPALWLNLFWDRENFARRVSHVESGWHCVIHPNIGEMQVFLGAGVSTQQGA